MKALESSDSPLKDTYLPAMISLRFYVTWKNLLLAYEGPRILWLTGQDTYPSANAEFDGILSSLLWHQGLNLSYKPWRS